MTYYLLGGTVAASTSATFEREFRKAKLTKVIFFAEAGHAGQVEMNLRAAGIDVLDTQQVANSGTAKHGYFGDNDGVALPTGIEFSGKLVFAVDNNDSVEQFAKIICEVVEL